MVRTIEIGGQEIGVNKPVFIIAEAGVNHNGDIHLAKKLVDAAVSAGVNAVKFQTFRTEDLTTRHAELAEYQVDNISKSISQFEMIRSLELDYDAFTELKRYCDNKNILFLSTPHTLDAMRFLDSIVPAFKIGSGDLTNLPFLEKLSELSKPIILSTGMSTLDEVRDAVEVIGNKGNDDLILLHCVTNYPAAIADMNLRAIETLRREFNLLVGFSDHSIDSTASIAAVSLGAVILEKHFTLDRDLPGPDHRASLNPAQLKEYVKSVRETESSLGDGIKKPALCEIPILDVVRKSLVASGDIESGILLDESMIDIKRPGTGISPRFLSELIGRRAKIAIPNDTLLSWDMLE
ncbi:MAG: N-acetylneuraminate synthase [Candidatus Thorarchaeota archaeon]